MIQITPHMRILVAIEPIDFRAGIDGLVGACRKRLQVDPFSGALFVFRNRARTAVKVLVYDGQGFWMVRIHPRPGTASSGIDCRGSAEVGDEERELRCGVSRSA